MNKVYELGKSVEDMLFDLADKTSIEGEIWRPIYSQEEKVGKEIIKSWMTSIGMTCREDAIGNLIGRIEGKNSETILIGSHMDTVKNGGKYDGAAGIAIGIKAAELLLKSGYTFNHSLEVIAFTEEEGSAYLSGYLGSKNFVGKITENELNDLDSNQVTFRQAMINNGYDPDKLSKAVRKDIKNYLELHIEQGPVLISNKLEIGIVENIVGLRVFEVKIIGRQDHAGTTPMKLRKDPVAVTCKFISQMTDYVEKLNSTPVFTIGNMIMNPGISNVIAKDVTFTIDLRDVCLKTLDDLTKIIDEILSEIKADGYGVDRKLLRAEEPVHLDKTLRDLLYASSNKLGFNTIKMPSGAGHDAQIIAPYIPSGLIFIPSENGRSHCPDEYTKADDLARGVLLLEEAIKALDC